MKYSIKKKKIKETKKYYQNFNKNENFFKKNKA